VAARTRGAARRRDDHTARFEGRKLPGDLGAAKTFAEARKQHGESELLDALVAEKPDVPRYHSAEEAEQAGLSRLAEAVALVQQKATPDELESYKQFTLSVAQRVAEAHEEEGEPVSQAERDAIERIKGTLGSD